MPDHQRPRLIFLTHASSDAEAWPFYQAFRSSGLDVKVICRGVSLRYSRRLWLLLVGWPRLIWSGFSLASKAASHLSANSILTAHDHILLLTFKIARCFRPRLWRIPHKLVLHGFIYTPARSRWVGLIKRTYYRLLLRNVDMVVCHSEHEIQSITQLTKPNRTCVSAVHYGIGEGTVIARWWQTYRDTKCDKSTTDTKIRILSAGRSSRDYQTLCKAMALLGDTFKCDIVCDSVESMPPQLEAPNITAHRSVYGEAYTRMILDADIIAIPLSEGEISAGQMVLLHALAAAKPVVITDTPTSSEYVQESRFLKLTPQRDPDAIADAVRSITEQMPLSFEDREGIRRLFEEQFSDTAHGQGVLEVYRKQLF